MKIFEVIKNPHSGVVLGVSIFGLTITITKKFRFWLTVSEEYRLNNISLENKNEKLEENLEKLKEYRPYIDHILLLKKQMDDPEFIDNLSASDRYAYYIIADWIADIEYNIAWIKPDYYMND